MAKTKEEYEQLAKEDPIMKQAYTTLKDKDAQALLRVDRDVFV